MNDELDKISTFAIPHGGREGVLDHTETRRHKAAGEASASNLNRLGPREEESARDMM